MQRPTIQSAATTADVFESRATDNFSSSFLEANLVPALCAATRNSRLSRAYLAETVLAMSNTFAEDRRAVVPLFRGPQKYYTVSRSLCSTSRVFRLYIHVRFVAFRLSARFSGMTFSLKQPQRRFVLPCHLVRASVGWAGRKRRHSLRRFHQL